MDNQILVIIKLIKKQIPSMRFEKLFGYVRLSSNRFAIVRVVCTHGCLLDHRCEDRRRSEQHGFSDAMWVVVCGWCGACIKGCG